MASPYYKRIIFWEAFWRLVFTECGFLLTAQRMQEKLRKPDVDKCGLFCCALKELDYCLVFLTFLGYFKLAANNLDTRNIT